MNLAVYRLAIEAICLDHFLQDQGKVVLLHIEAIIVVTLSGKLSLSDTSMACSLRSGKDLAMHEAGSGLPPGGGCYIAQARASGLRGEVRGPTAC